MAFPEASLRRSAQRFFIASAILRLPSADILRFDGVRFTAALPRFAPLTLSPASKLRACCRRAISLSISTRIWLTCTCPPLFLRPLKRLRTGSCGRVSYRYCATRLNCQLIYCQLPKAIFFAKGVTTLDNSSGHIPSGLPLKPVKRISPRRVRYAAEVEERIFNVGGLDAEGNHWTQSRRGKGSR